MPRNPNSAPRDALELAQAAKTRFETADLAAARHGLDPERIRRLSEAMLDGIHRGPCQRHAPWVLEAATAMITAVMAVNREPVPMAGGIDPAAYAMAVLKDLKTEAAGQGLDFAALEQAAVAILRDADASGHDNPEAYWALHRATAAVELALARERSRADQDAGDSIRPTP